MKEKKEKKKKLKMSNLAYRFLMIPLVILSLVLSLALQTVSGQMPDLLDDYLGRGALKVKQDAETVSMDSNYYDAFEDNEASKAASYELAAQVQEEGSVLLLTFGTVISLLLALLINETRNKRFGKVVQSTMLLPYFISWVIVSYILYGILSTDKGVVNAVLTNLGMKRINFYSRPELWRGILTFARIWKSAGYNMIIYLAAIMGIDDSLYEAAAIDGSNRWQCIKRITLPLLTPPGLGTK